MLDLDRVLPAIAEVVEVVQRLGAEILKHIDEPRLARIERAFVPIGIGNAPADVLGAQFVEVTVWSRRMASGTSMRRRTCGFTSSSVIFRRAMAPAVMPPAYDQPSLVPSSTAAARRAGWRMLGDAGQHVG